MNRLRNRQQHLGFVTFGCKVNQYESAFMAEQAEKLNFTLSSPEAADILVVNTCTVTARTDRQVRQCLRQWGRLQTPPTILVTGCYAQRAPQELANFPGVKAVFGNVEKGRWLELLAAMSQTAGTMVRVSDIQNCNRFVPMPLGSFWGHTRAFMKIQDGCGHYCSYCIVPLVRGPERSLPSSDLLRQLQQLSDAGFQEIVFTGVNLSRYGRDLPGDKGLIDLVRLLRQTSWPLRFRFSSLEPQDISYGLLRELSDWPHFCPHFHIPLQSGASAVLAAMHRNYQPAWFEALIRELTALFPQAAVGLDVMVGFPTETATAFEQTKELLNRLPVAYLHVFPYSARPGTEAAVLSPQTSAREVGQRARSLRDLSHGKKLEFYQRHLGQVAEVLVEGPVAHRPGWLKGLTANYLRVMLPGPPEWVNRFIRLKLIEMNGQDLIGVAM